ncbi:glycoside hydrolase family 2 protein [Janthinobacterium agaricidamnosum]|uniref:Glycosyl hydrolases family 2, TIM barrel domain protein n=1 Tax=Janthinobacterium agaricidamnosum NBRC 102515 = DSM 9628 TaxID=1349767 RepID=W0VAC8_9BURK|nr:glycoside hydrolase family 2 [Janthinobacterium agaricidamnosum]CDG84841.1 glycosyl hydrolases family 2, TIM barrel domain protein [Janthinobacterium agaricidamnosum NBRC 102515 = DSM 9628]
MPDFAYPRPQLVREQWLSLNGRWDFAFDDGAYVSVPERPVPFPATWTHAILVPFPPESQASGVGDRGFHKACWYRREFDAQAGGGRVLLHFGAVDYSAKVWVNGQLVAEHEGGHTPFWSDISAVLNSDGRQTVIVYAEDDPHDLAKPRGKQDWQLQPHSIWYPRTTGIWQTVWLENVASTYIQKLRWTPLFEGYEIACEVFAAGDIAHDLSVEVRIWHGDTLLADDRYAMLDHEANRKIALSDPGIDDTRNELLWSPERPTLLDAVLTLRHGDKVLDTVSSYTAMRSVAINRDRFMLNGRPYPLRLVLDQGYWPDTLLTAPSDDALRTDVELAKAMGFNGVRKHQKIENPRYLYWADKLGLLVWEEMPSAYRFSSKAITRMVREWTEAIERDYSHPCVLVWVPFNESWGVPNLTAIQAHRNAVEALYHLTHTLDSTRPVIGNDGWEASATDILGIHDYDCDPERLQARYAITEGSRNILFDQRRPGGRILTLDGFPHRGQPIVLTEFGGIAFSSNDDANADRTWGYSRVGSEAAFLDLYRRLLAVVNTAQLFSGFCYTQFADTFQEANGLLMADRTPKVALELISAATRNIRSD